MVHRSLLRSITPLIAIATCVALVGILVVPFYLLPRSIRDLPRNAPRHIVARFAVVALACVCAPLIVAALLTPAARAPHSLWRWLGVHTTALVQASLVGPLLVMVLFAGPLTEWAIGSCAARRRARAAASAVAAAMPLDDAAAAATAPAARRAPSTLLLVRARALLVAPISEEWIFRACMFPLIVSAGYGCSASLLMNGALFGVAHLHHIFDKVEQGMAWPRALKVVGFQFCFSSIFGTIASFLVLRTGHVTGAILAHAFCNLMGPPDLGFTSDRHPLHAHQRTIAVAYLVGIAAFALLLFPATNPTSFDSVLWATCAAN